MRWRRQVSEPPSWLEVRGLPFPYLRKDPARLLARVSERRQSDVSIGLLPILRKEVIQPQVPLRLPCYDFTPVADLTVVGCLLAVSAPASGKTNSHGVTGGVYKARERIHRGMLIHDY